ncbi:MAG: alanine dehydrogenase [Deltaproteobacteria bacterium RIFCSPLOWO2_02_FULL_53_8]|nr:MAG: alanine dehydrogenase [Deltaproteobacteria bacterium RIFCSPLOWO2_02_FULL_53_8]
MIIGIPKEIKEAEFRVACVPSGVAAFRAAGHTVLVEKDAGTGSGISDTDFQQAGATICPSAEEVWQQASLILKVKEPRPKERRYFRDGLCIFTFFHLAANHELAEELLKTGVTAVAYETIVLDDGTLPILAPMSEVAGRLSVLAGCHYLMKPYGGSGILLPGVPGVAPGAVVIIGAGVVGVNALMMAVGIGAQTTIIDTRVAALRRLDALYAGAVTTLASNRHNIEKAVTEADLVIGAVHIPGGRTPTLVTAEMVSRMKKGSVIVDVSVDQGGCIETIRPTTHANPTYEVDGVIHYGVANMPGAVPRTSTFALTNATLPYAINLASNGVLKAAIEDPAFKRGVNIYKNKVTHPMVAAALQKDYCPLAGA